MAYIERYACNTRGRDFLMTDNHGCWSEVRTFMQMVNFNEAVDRLFHGGDLGDRGPDSHECLYWLEKPWFHGIRGNHEMIAIGHAVGRHSVDNFRRNGGDWFIRLPDELKKAYAMAFATMPHALEIDTPWGKAGVVHAEPLETADSTSWDITTAVLENFENYSHNFQKDVLEVLLWSRERFKAKRRDEVTDVSRVYVGHSPVFEPFLLGNVYYIDTGLVYGNKLTVVNLTEDTIVQVPAQQVYWTTPKEPQ